MSLADVFVTRIMKLNADNAELRSEVERLTRENITAKDELAWLQKSHDAFVAVHRVTCDELSKKLEAAEAREHARIHPVSECQKCGKMGGYVATFEYLDRHINESRWICPYCIDNLQADLSREREKVYRFGVDWCDVCNKPQMIAPDGSHDCRTIAELHEDAQRERERAEAFKRDFERTMVLYEKAERERDAQWVKALGYEWAGSKANTPEFMAHELELQRAADELETRHQERQRAAGIVRAEGAANTFSTLKSTWDYLEAAAVKILEGQPEVEQVIESAVATFAAWPKWKQDELRAHLGQTEGEGPVQRLGDNLRYPQLRDGEPAKSGRHCPIDNHEED